MLYEVITHQGLREITPVHENSETGKNRKIAEEQAAFRPGSIQMGLFRDTEQVLSDSLKKLDISRMTPLDAINYLNEFV